MKAKIKRGQWIVKLEKLIQCDKCNSYFTDSISYKKHQEIHEKEIKVETIKHETFSPTKNNSTQHEEKENKVGKKYQEMHYKEIKVELIKHETFSPSKDDLHQDENKESQPRNKLTCGNYDETFDKLHQLQTHYNFNHKDTKLICSKCNKKFPFKSQLEQHSEKCDGETNSISANLHFTKIIGDDSMERFQCKECHRIFKSSKVAYCHFYEVHREKKFKCHLCNKCFPYKFKLNKHTKLCDGIMKTKTFGKSRIKDVEYKEIFDEDGKKLFQCCKCEKVFERSINILHHIYKVHREKKFKCEKCNKMFAFKSNMERHIQICDGILRIRKANGSMKSRIKDVEYKEIFDEDGKKIFQCCKCEKVFEKSVLVLHHIYKIHRDKKFKCDKCNKMFAFKSDMERHAQKCDGTFRVRITNGICNRSKEVNYKIVLENESKSFQCNLCKEKFSSRTKFYVHFRNHMEKKYKCEKCTKMFVYKSLQENHTKICNGIMTTKTFTKGQLKDVEYKETFDENGKKHFQCCKCEKVFEKSVLALHHIYKVHREKKFKCDKCNKMFTFKSDMNRHIQACDGMSRIRKANGKMKRKKITKDKIKNVEYKEIFVENGKKLFQCCKCVKVFKKMVNVIQHIYMIHREKKFKCVKCSKLFAFKAHMKRHVQKCDGIFKSRTRIGSVIYTEISVDGVKKYQCTKCQNVYENKESIYPHFQMKHREKKYKAINDIDGNKKFQCLDCGIECFSIKSILKHIYCVHREKKHKCDKCDKSFIYPSKLKIHLKSCSGLKEPKKTLKNDTYKVEVDNEGKKVFHCLKCEKVFDEMVNVSKHIYKIHREKKFKCDKCSKMFAFKSKLKIHVKKCDEILRIQKVNGIFTKGKIKDVEYREIHSENGKKVFQCNKCEKIFGKIGNVVQHIYLLHKEKKHKCDKCNKMFAFKSNLRKHVQKCDGILRVRKAYSKEANYKMIVSKEGNIFQCKKCEEIFSERMKFHVHFRIHLEKEFKCDKCSGLFLYKSLLEKHIKICDGIFRVRSGKNSRTGKYEIIENDEGKQFQCINCKEMFENRNDLYVHYRIHMEKKFKCEKCSRMFIYKSFQENHSKMCNVSVETRDVNPTFKVFIDWDGKKKYQCDFCDKSYESLDNFNEHSCENHYSQKKSIRNKLKDVKYKEISDKDGNKKFQCLDCGKECMSTKSIGDHIFHFHRKKIHKCDICYKSFTSHSKLLNHLENCSGPNVADTIKPIEEKINTPKVKDESMLPMLLESNSAEKEIDNEVCNTSIKEQEHLKTEFKTDFIKTDGNNQDLDEGDPLQIVAEDSVDSINDNKELSILGI